MRELALANALLNTRNFLDGIFECKPKNHKLCGVPLYFHIIKHICPDLTCSASTAFDNRPENINIGILHSMQCYWATYRMAQLSNSRVGLSQGLGVLY